MQNNSIFWSAIIRSAHFYENFGLLFLYTVRHLRVKNINRSNENHGEVLSWHLVNSIWVVAAAVNTDLMAAAMDVPRIELV